MSWSTSWCEYFVSLQCALSKISSSGYFVLVQIFTCRNDGNMLLDNPLEQCCYTDSEIRVYGKTFHTFPSYLGFVSTWGSLRCYNSKFKFDVGFPLFLSLCINWSFTFDSIVIPFRDIDVVLFLLGLEMQLDRRTTVFFALLRDYSSV